MIDEGADAVAGRVWQQIGDPDEAASTLAGIVNLYRGVVMRKPRGSDDRPGEPTCVIIDVDDELTRDEPAPEGDHSRAVLETSVDDETGNKACV